MDPSKLYYVYRCFNDPANHYWLVQSKQLLPETNVQQHHTFVLRPMEWPCGWLERVDPRLRQCVVRQVEGPEGFRAQLRLSDPNLLARMVVESVEQSMEQSGNDF